MPSEPGIAAGNPGAAPRFVSRTDEFDEPRDRVND